MEQKKLSHVLLTAGGITGLGGLVMLFLIVPAMAAKCREAYPEIAWLFWPALIFIWAVGAMYMAALYQYIRICIRIGQGRSFCPQNGKGLRVIANLLFVGAAACAAAPVLLAAAVNIGGAVLTAGLLLGLASAALGLLAWALGKLVMHAAALQEENDLTV